jgi:hypothetical protein
MLGMLRTPFPPSYLEERPLCAPVCRKSLHLSGHFRYTRWREWEREKKRVKLNENRAVMDRGRATHEEPQQAARTKGTSCLLSPVSRRGYHVSTFFILDSADSIVV